jgi:hypothetical protein
MNYYLKAVDEAALYEALEAAGLMAKQYDPEDPANQRPSDLALDAEWHPTGKFTWVKTNVYDLDVIGDIYKPTGKMLINEYGEYPEMAAIEGYHANIRGITAEQVAMLPTIAKPNNPVRMWAGD